MFSVTSLRRSIFSVLAKKTQNKYKHLPSSVVSKAFTTLANTRQERSKIILFMAADNLHLTPIELTLMHLSALHSYLSTKLNSINAEKIVSFVALLFLFTQRKSVVKTKSFT